MVRLRGLYSLLGVIFSKMGRFQSSRSVSIMLIFKKIIAKKVWIFEEKREVLEVK